MKIDVLDHGYVEFVEAWGHGKDGKVERFEDTTRDDDFEVGIIEAARQSTQGSFRGWDQDAKLLKHLHDNQHGTPFEFAGMVIEVQAPIFVFREWHRHRTQSYNEMSARYTPLPDLYYVPDIDNVVERIEAGIKTTNKQATSLRRLDYLASQGIRELAETWVGPAHLQQVYRLAEEVYQASLQAGIPKELARLVMPVGHYSRMRASANLRNWLAFLTLRCDSNAQWEIRQYANAVGCIIEAKFPQTYKLWATSTG